MKQKEIYERIKSISLSSIGSALDNDMFPGITKAWDQQAKDLAKWFREVIKERDIKIGGLESIHKRQKEKIETLQKEKAELRETIKICRCPKCDKPMYDKFSGSFHNIDKCGSPRPAVAFNSENA